MINFQYTRASDVADAIRQIAADPRSKFIAGGTNLIDLMKEDVERPARLIDITRLPLNSVEETAELLRIRPETVKTRLHRARQLLRDQLNKQIGPVMMDAFPFAGLRCERLTASVLSRLALDK